MKNTALKILIYDTNYVSGVPRVIPILKIKAWQKMNCEITILCTKEGMDFFQKKLNNVSYISIDYTYSIKNAYSLPLQFFLVSIKALQKIFILRNQFDVVYSQSSVIDFLLVPFILRSLDKKIRWYAMVDNIVPKPQERPGPFLKKFLPYLAFLFGNILLKNTDGIFVVTNFLLDFYQSRGYKVFKIGDGYGIDIDIFTGPIARNVTKFDAVYTGRLHEAKGVFDLVAVMKEVVKNKPNFQLGILGDGEEIVKAKLHKEIKNARLQKNITFTGYVTGKEKGDLLRSCGFFLFLSYDEGCPHAVIEAFAMNKLVIAYDLPIYHSVFKRYLAQHQLIVFKEKEYKKIAQYILSMPAKKKNFTNKLEDFTWDSIVHNELNIMKREC